MKLAMLYSYNLYANYLYHYPVIVISSVYVLYLLLCGMSTLDEVDNGNSRKRPYESKRLAT